MKRLILAYRFFFTQPRQELGSGGRNNEAIPLTSFSLAHVELLFLYSPGLQQAWISHVKQSRKCPTDRATECSKAGSSSLEVPSSHVPPVGVKLTIKASQYIAVSMPMLFSQWQNFLTINFSELALSLSDSQLYLEAIRGMEGIFSSHDDPSVCLPRTAVVPHLFVVPLYFFGFHDSEI